MSMPVSLISAMATKRGVAVLLVLYAAVFGTILVTLGQLADVSGGTGILDFEQGYSARRVADVFGSYGDAGMALYRRIQFLDLFNPALYTALASVLTYLLWRGRGPEWVCLMPVPAGLADYAENVTLLRLSRSFPDLPEGLVALSSALSLVKTGLLVVGLLPLVVGVVLAGSRILRSSPR